MSRIREVIGGLSRFSWLGVLLVLAIHTGILAWSATRHSPTWDEPGHLVAGLSHWKFGRFELYAVNPPLVRSVAALPVLLQEPELDWEDYQPDPQRRSEVPLGRRFVQLNGERSLACFIALGDFKFTSDLLAGTMEARDPVDGLGNRFQSTWLGRLPMPLPKDCVLGMDIQRRDFERGYAEVAWCAATSIGGRIWWLCENGCSGIRKPGRCSLRTSDRLIRNGWASSTVCQPRCQAMLCNDHERLGSR